MTGIFPRWFWVLAGIIVAGLLIWFFLNIIIYVLIAGVLSLIGQPLVNLLLQVQIGNWRLPSWLAAFITMLLFLVTFGLALALLVPAVVKEAGFIAGLDLQSVALALEQELNRFETWLRQYGLISEEQRFYEYLQMRMREFISLTNIQTVFNAIINATGNFFIALFSIGFILFFFLKENNLFQRIFIALSPEGKEDRFERVFTGIKSLLRRYFLGILLQVTLIVIFVSSLLWLFGIEKGFIIALLAALFNIIPYVGPLIGAITGVLLGMGTVIGMGRPDLLLPVSLKIAGVFAIMQLLDNLFLQPIIFSGSVKAHPLEIFLVVLAAGTTGGIVWMILAIPIYTVVRVVAKEFFSEFKLVKKLTRNL